MKRTYDTWSPLARLFLMIGVILLGIEDLSYATSIGATYDPGNRRLTVNVTGVAEQWNDLEVEVNDGDVVGTFSTQTANWSVDSIIQAGGKTYVRLYRSSMTDQDQTVVIDHIGPATRGGRRGRGTGPRSSHLGSGSDSRSPVAEGGKDRAGSGRGGQRLPPGHARQRRPQPTRHG